LPKGAARWPRQRDRGQCFIQVEAAMVDRMRAMRRPSQSYRDVILRLAPPPVRRRWHEVAAKYDACSDRRGAADGARGKRLGAPGKSRSERALDERAAPREGSFARPTGARLRSL
jgi:hypothetical protein